MPLNPETQLALNDQAAQHDWPQDQLERATKAQEFTAVGKSELAHVEAQQQLHDQQLREGLAITALRPEQQASLDNLAISGADQDRLDRVKAQMLAENEKTSV